MKEHHHTLKQGFLHRDGVTMQCPFRSPASIVTQSTLAGKPPEIQFVPSYCGLLCPLFEHQVPTTVRLHCTTPSVEYVVEVVTPPPPSKIHKLANA